MLTSKIVGALVLLFVLTPVAKWTRRFIYALFDQVPIGNPSDEATRNSVRTMGAIGVAGLIAAEGIKSIKNTWSSHSASPTTKNHLPNKMQYGGKSIGSEGKNSGDIASSGTGGFLPEMREQDQQGKPLLLSENTPMLENNQQEAFRQKFLENNAISGIQKPNPLYDKGSLRHGLGEANNTRTKSLLNHESSGQGFGHGTQIPMISTSPPGTQSQHVIYGPNGKPLPPSSQLMNSSLDRSANPSTNLSSSRSSSYPTTSSHSLSTKSGNRRPITPTPTTTSLKTAPSLSQRVAKHSRVAEKVSRSVGGTASAIAGAAVGAATGFRAGHHVMRVGTELSGFVGRQVGRVTALATHTGSTGIKIAQQKISDFRNSRNQR